MCHNANFEESTLTSRFIKAFGSPPMVRTIVYGQTRDRVIENARELASIGTASLVVFNTESYGGGVEDVDEMARALDDFLRRANYAVYAIEPGNELDTPSWGISNETIVAVGRKAAEVCKRHGVICLSPSFLTGPEEGRFEAVARELAGHVDAMALHPYYCSVGGFPDTPQFRKEYPKAVRGARWRYGSVEEKINIALAAAHGLPVWITELGCPTAFDGIGADGQTTYRQNLRSLHSENVPYAFDFCVFDAMVPQGEMKEGKDWGAVRTDGTLKPSAYAINPSIGAYYASEQSVHESTPPHFTLGFEKWASHEPDLIGLPLKNEWGVPGRHFQQQPTTHGLLSWADLTTGSLLTFFHAGESALYVWEETWPASVRVEEYIG